LLDWIEVDLSARPAFAFKVIFVLSFFWLFSLILLFSCPFVCVLEIARAHEKKNYVHTDALMVAIDFQSLHVCRSVACVCVCVCVCLCVCVCVCVCVCGVLFCV